MHKNAGRKMTPKGQMSSSGSGPAIMMMPSHIRATFMPDPPLKHIPPPKRKRPKTHPSEQNGSSKSKRSITGVAAYMQHFEHGSAPDRVVRSTPASMKKLRAKKREEKVKAALDPLVEEYRNEQKECSGEYQGMNCYNTLFVGRLAYEVTEGKLLREFEAFGPVKDLKLIKTVKGSGEGENGGDAEDGGSSNKEGKSRGYAFVEFEQEEDMKRAYRSADAMRIEGRPIVVDVERGHTVPNWLPRRLGGGLGGTRLGGKDVNVATPGRFNPNAPREQPTMDVPGGGAPPGYGHGPPTGRGGPEGAGGGRGMYGQFNGPPPGYYNGRGGGGPPPGYYNGRGGGGRGPPPPNYNNGYSRGGPPPPRDYRNDYRGGPPPRDRGMKRGREYGGPPPDRRDRRRY
mmetsp:Transcript_2956/g.4296  ORF Transcript_2956/g.4296 Transcript_2956/m.4296 type:complete len:399 (-) Transcript_2956:162-1358(-)